MVRRATTVLTSSPVWGALTVLPENASAVRAAQRLLSGKPATPLVLHGSPGVGKSAVVASLVAEFLASPVTRTARQLSAAEMPRPSKQSEALDLTDLIWTDLMVVEDLQHLSVRDVPTLCQLLDERQVHARPTVLTATSGPAGLTAFPRRLTNRLAAGLVVRLDTPGINSRRTLLERFAAERNVHLTPEALDWMATTADGIRPLLGFIGKLKPVMKGYPHPLTAAQVQEWLVEPTETETKSRLDRLVNRVASAFGVKAKEILGPSRLRTVLLPRQVAMTLARDTLKLPLAEIGKHFGGRDHTTVMHAVKKIEEQAQADVELAGRLRELRAEVG